MANALKNGGESANMVDELNEDFDKFETWVLEHWRIVAAISAGIVVVVAVISTAVALNASAKAKTAALFASASSKEQLSSALAAHPSAPQAGIARMKLAIIQMQSKDYAPAISNFTDIAKSKDAPEVLRWIAELNVAYAIELKGEDAKAAEAFSSVSAKNLLPEQVRSEAAYNAGRIFVKIGQLDKAKEALASSANASPSAQNAIWSSLAKSLLQRLNAATPSPQKSAKQAKKPQG